MTPIHQMLGPFECRKPGTARAENLAGAGTDRAENLAGAGTDRAENLAGRRVVA